MRRSSRRLVAVAATVMAVGGLGWARVPAATAAHAALPSADVTAFGNAVSYGSTSTVDLHEPVIGMARTVTGLGYWEAAADGGVFSFGDAHFYGSTGAIRLNQPVVGIAATPTGHGYWLTAADGGVFSFGDAHFYGSTGAIRLNEPVTGVAASPDGAGYWLVASDGGVFNFGTAHLFGSFGGGVPGVGPSYMHFVGLAPTPDGGGYWIVASGFCATEGSTATVSSPPGTFGEPGTLAEVFANRLFSCADQAQFRFAAPAPASTAYQVGYVTNPVAGGSGLPVHVAGSYFLQVTLHPISAVDYTATDIFPVGTTNIVEMRQTENFEGYVTWVIGLRHRTPFWFGHPGPGMQEFLVVDIGAS